MLNGRDYLTKKALRQIGVLGAGADPEQDILDESNEIAALHVAALQSREKLKWMRVENEYTIKLNKNNYQETLPSRALPSDFFRVLPETVKLMTETISTTYSSDILGFVESALQRNDTDFTFDAETMTATTDEDFAAGTAVDWFYPRSSNINYKRLLFDEGGTEFDLDDPYPYDGTAGENLLVYYGGSIQKETTHFTYNDTTKKVTTTFTAVAGVPLVIFYPVTEANYKMIRFTATGASNAFALTGVADGTLAENAFVAIEGSIQDPSSHYTYAGGDITISGALLPAGAKVDIFFPTTAGAIYKMQRFSTGGTTYTFIVKSTHYSSRSQSGIDVVCHKKYFSQDLSKDRQSAPTMVYFQSDHDSYTLHVWPEVIEVQETKNVYLCFTYEKYIGDLSTDAAASTTSISIPKQLEEGYVDELAWKLSFFYGLSTERQLSLERKMKRSNKKAVLGSDRNVGTRLHPKMPARK